MIRIKRQWLLQTAALVSMVVITILTFLWMANYTASKQAPVHIGPYWEEDWDIYTIQDGEKQSLSKEDFADYEGKLYFSSLLSPWGKERFYNTLQLHLEEGYSDAMVWLDDFLLYHHTGNSAERIGYWEITLPADYAGRRLTVSLNHSAEGKTMPFFHLTNLLVENAIISAQANQMAFPAGGLAAVFIATIGLFFYGVSQDRLEWRLLLLSATAFGQTFYFVSMNTEITANPIISGILIQLSRSALFSFPCLFLLSGMKKRRRFFAPFVVLPSLFYLCLSVGQFAVPAFSGISYRAGEGFYFSIVALIGFSILEYRDGNDFFRLFLPVLAASLSGIVLVWLASFLQDGNFSNYIHVLWTQVIQHFPDQPLFWWNTLLLVLCFFVSLLSFIRQSVIRDLEFQAVSLKESLASEELEVLQESSRCLREMRHDVVHHYSVLLGLARGGQTERIAVYLSDLISDSDRILALNYTLHPTTNAILTAIVSRSRARGIHTECKVELPASLTIRDTDLCMLLMNLLQNALEACELVEDGGKKQIQVIMHIRGLYLYIGVENTHRTPLLYDKKTKLYQSTKSEKASHGLGLKTARSIARKYNSELIIEATPDSFSVSTALKLPDS